MHIFGTTYFDEISIFELSKDHAFRIWSTFMNPEQFLILVPYLITKSQNLHCFNNGYFYYFANKLELFSAIKFPNGRKLIMSVASDILIFQISYF